MDRRRSTAERKLRQRRGRGTLCRADGLSWPSRRFEPRVRKRRPKSDPLMTKPRSVLPKALAVQELSSWLNAIRSSLPSPLSRSGDRREGVGAAPADGFSRSVGFAGSRSPGSGDRKGPVPSGGGAGAPSGRARVGVRLRAPTARSSEARDLPSSDSSWATWSSIWRTSPRRRAGPGSRRYPPRSRLPSSGRSAGCWVGLSVGGWQACSAGLRLGEEVLHVARVWSRSDSKRAASAEARAWASQTPAASFFR